MFPGQARLKQKRLFFENRYEKKKGRKLVTLVKYVSESSAAFQIYHFVRSNDSLEIRGVFIGQHRF
jgi:hypothetical protein